MLLCLCSFRDCAVLLLGVFNKFLELNNSHTLKINSGVSHPAVFNGLISHLNMKVEMVSCEKH
jgi:hypothetical protein